MKKKYITSKKDKEDWIAFTKQMGTISSKEDEFINQNKGIDKLRKLDLHGLSLDESNKKVKKFISESFNFGYKKLLVVTGKGLRSKSHENPYISEKLSVLKYSVPEFIENDKDLSSKIIKISKANIKDGGEGAIYIFLKNKKNLKDKFC